MEAGKAVIVTGAGRGIGKSLALANAAAGSQVVLAEIDADAGSKTEELILSTGQKAVFIKTDESIPGDIFEMVRAVNELFGKIDI